MLAVPTSSELPQHKTSEVNEPWNVCKDLTETICEINVPNRDYKEADKMKKKKNNNVEDKSEIQSYF